MSQFLWIMQSEIAKIVTSTCNACIRVIMSTVKITTPNNLLSNDEEH